MIKIAARDVIYFLAVCDDLLLFALIFSGSNRFGIIFLTTTSSNKNKHKTMVRIFIQLWLLVAMINSCMKMVIAAANNRNLRGIKIKNGTMSSVKNTKAVPVFKIISGNWWKYQAPACGSG